MTSRRQFITLLGGAAAAWPVAARGQQSNRQRLVGAVMAVAQGNLEGQAWASAFRKGLEEKGWLEGQSIRFDLRWASGDLSTMRTQAAELVQQQCDVIVTHATPATLAVRRETQTIPNVFVVVNDPVSSGFVASIPHPGGNSTGFTNFDLEIGSKWLQLLKEIAPAATRVALLLNPVTYPGGLSGAQVRSIETAARSFGVVPVVTPFRNAAEIETAIQDLIRDRIDGLIVMPDTSTTLYSKVIAASAARKRLPTIYPYRDFVVAGGLLSYGVDRADLYRRAAGYVDQILRGAKPGDLPVQAPVKYEMIINLKTAKALGITMPDTFLVRADEVIE